MEHKESFMRYMKSFADGYMLIVTSKNPEELSEPTIDYDDISSIGFCDGFNYGDYCVRIGCQFDINNDHFIAEMDKRFTTIPRRQEEHKKEFGRR